MKARKLLAKAALERIWLRHQVGVPIERLRRDFNIELSLPSFIRLLEYYTESIDIEQNSSITNTICASLFPTWLNSDCKTIQSQPRLWKYIGKFPVGSWLRVENENN